MLFAGHDDLLICARRGSPLAIGYRRRRDVHRLRRARAGAAHQPHPVPRGGRLGGADARGAAVYDADGGRSTRPDPQTALSGALIGKGNYRHFMHKEIHEQPAVLGDTLRSFANPATTASRCPSCRSTSRTLPRLAIGRLRHRLLRLHGRALLVRAARRPAGRSRHRAPSSATASRRSSPGSAALFVSQSGETADTLAALRCVKAQGLTTVALVNVPDSTIAREADVRLRTLAGPEIGVASTKAFTTQLATLACLAIGAARARGRLSRRARGGADRGARRGAGARRRGADAGRDTPSRSRTASCRRATCSTSAAAPCYRAGARGCAEAEGDQLHPRRGLCRGRAEARPDRADRRERPGDRRGAARSTCSRRPRATCRRSWRAAARSSS